MRQTRRTNNAAVVAEGAVKPTSVYSVERVEDKLDVIAHLSEGVPRYWFVDTAALQGFLANELDYGLRMASKKVKSSRRVGEQSVAPDS